MFTVNKLKISGFKSFAHQTELLIEDGVTGIIGPNGCGKSNIFEAIRWVMGESSSKSLRSGSMDEVIFNGTQNIPAKNFAEVSIELSNFEGQLPGNLDNEKKLLISRTIERGVGSFYKINNNDVRAKDISILFYDSGSGPRSSSIISQGNIDQIIKSKPIDRKIILEDAAGTSGLQARRHESELKLQATEDNLSKIDINLNGLIDQKKSLSRQARQADKYEQISQNIKFFQSILVFTQWKKSVNEMDLIHNDLKRLIDGTKILINQISTIQNSIDLEKEKLTNIEDEKNILNNEFIQLNSEINKYNSQLEGIANKKNEVEKFLKTVQNDSEIEKNRYKEIKEYLDNLVNKISKPSNLDTERKKLIELNLQETKLKNKLKELETIYVNEIQLSLGEEFKSDNLKENKEINNKRKDELKEIIYLATKKQQSEEKEFSTQKKLNETIELNIKHVQNQINNKKKDILKTNEYNQKLNSQIKKFNQEIEACSKKQTQIETELKTLNQLTNNNNLSNDSIVNLLKIRKGYENAIYAALTIELDATLKESPKRWTKTKNEKILPIENCLAQYVDGPKELNLILSQIGFVGDQKRAIDKQKHLKVGQSLVDINGSIWRWDGFISEDNLQRKKLIDAQLKIKKLINEQSNYTAQLGSLEKKKIELSQKQINNDKVLKDENQNLEMLYKKSDSNYHQLTNSKQNLSILRFNLETSNKKVKALNIELNLIMKELENIKKKELLSNKNDNNKNDKNEVQKEIQELDIKVENKREEINLIKESIMKEELNKNYYKNDLEKTKIRFRECEKQISTLRTREIHYFNERKKLEELPLSIKKKLDHFTGLNNELQNKIKFNNQKNDAIKQLVDSEEKKFVNLNKEREYKINEKTKFESILENHSLKEKEFRGIIFQQSKIQPEEFEENLKSRNIEIQDYDSIKHKLENLINQREQMGPVNLRAKVEEELVNKSIEELELEKLDLSQAIEKLRIAINKINNEGKNRLLKAYENVNKNFSDLFKKLFNGGEARLELIRSDDPLQTGIEIYARPPGKKLSSISLLSGGEKALTAISLIFSIFLINPSPICILDEVDAALDETNVEKFCNILLELKKQTKTKFLIITHHKITMTSIDRVYGVTMAQKGISDIVSVDFKEIDFKEAV